MITFLNRGIVLFGWTALMAIVWFLFVPRGLSVTSFVLLALSGPLVLVLGLALWRGQQPSLSIRQIRAKLDAEESVKSATRAQR